MITFHTRPIVHDFDKYIAIRAYLVYVFVSTNKTTEEREKQTHTLWAHTRNEAKQNKRHKQKEGKKQNNKKEQKTKKWHTNLIEPFGTKSTAHCLITIFYSSKNNTNIIIIVCFKHSS